MEKTFQEKLNAVQVSLDARKSKRNSFGNYAYRSAEDILEALKPHLKKTGLALNITDDVVLIGEHYYIKAVVTVSDGNEHATSVGWAREPETKKGYDESQLTGSASSYARKTALCGLFAIDDGVDADSTNKGSTKSEAIAVLEKCKTTNELTQAWNDYANEFGNDNEFRTAYMKQLQAINNANKS